MEPKTIGTQCNVWPRCHAYKDMGPFDIRLAQRFQHGLLLKNWYKDKIQISLDQPDPSTNLTMIRMMFGPVPAMHSAIAKWYNASTTRLNDGSEPGKRTGRPLRVPGTIRVYLKRRICDQMEHPIPTGVWIGTLTYTDDWAYHVLQLSTMQVVKTEKPGAILIPGDEEFNESLTNPPGIV